MRSALQDAGSKPWQLYELHGGGRDDPAPVRSALTGGVAAYHVQIDRVCGHVATHVFKIQGVPSGVR